MGRSRGRFVTWKYFLARFVTGTTFGTFCFGICIKTYVILVVEVPIPMSQISPLGRNSGPFAMDPLSALGSNATVLKFAATMSLIDELPYRVQVPVGTVL